MENEASPGLSKALVLIGPMGVGKTTVGKKLARNLKVPFIDTDAAIVAEHGEIAQIFASKGEPFFRQLEEQSVADAVSHLAVVATGGGAVLSQQTRDYLATHATVIYLSTDGRHMKSRLVGGKRPLLQNGFDDWLRIYEERKPIYESVADITINTSGKTLATIISELKEKMSL